ncbi:MAG TPA: bifunctional UDP-N-acetylglucosamine diphosphorylase/glucosamine-1-phosphate N-acetyltransferase GlmU [Firmicutes bacterium]|nr:bifunctional UDP-N-acetylglucosamine diphosphorylase/glucosamine-1-phosphate N-acetyltransferase GlmU [Bacillota bacterium]HBK59886.1 bifunctional UDP-N-acetylglucosamine diphosphorylase/glucosamine-1-phosphate N-acetyltransferase GlmU [Bacillota bacterium]
MSFVGLVLAAGLGKRMKSSLPKALHQVAGQPMIDHVVGTLAKSGASRVITVVGHEGQALQEHLAGRSEIVWQHEQLGTGHAAAQAGPALAGYVGNVVIIPGDVPLLPASSIQNLIEVHEAGGYAATVLTMVLDEPGVYGRVVRDCSGRVSSIVEYCDASDAIRAVREVNTGVYCFDNHQLAGALPLLSNENKQGEYYLTDVISALISQDLPVGAVALDDASEGMGVNSRAQLAAAEQAMRDRKRLALMEEGVTLVDPASTFVDAQVEIGRDTVIMPFTVISGSTSIGQSCNIGPYVQIRDSSVGDRCNIGPFAFLRPGTVLGDRVKVGDFVEVKNSRVGEGTKVPHLSYIGDAVLGSGVNVGAGTITCNYDGVAKHTTVIDNGAFVGANSNLVAPVRVGQNAYIATGSTVTTNVPPEALAIARARQENKDGWAARRRAALAAGTSGTGRTAEAGGTAGTAGTAGDFKAAEDAREEKK